MDFVILDLEWNGSYSKKVHHYVNEIIEFGAVKINEKLNVTDTFSMLIKPKIGKKISSHIADLTHISTEELKSYGEDFMSSTEKFAAFCEGCVVMTWGTSDILTLMDNYAYYTGERTVPFLEHYCNLQEYCEHVMNLHDPASQLGLQNCAEILGINSEGKELHRAYTDAMLSLSCLTRTYDKEKIKEFVFKADDEFYRRLTFKNKVLTDLKNPKIDKSKLFINCDDCNIRAEQLTHFKMKNKSFNAKFRCPKCRKHFDGRINIRLRYDGVDIKKRIIVKEPVDVLGD